MTQHFSTHSAQTHIQLVGMSTVQKCWQKSDGDSQKHGLAQVPRLFFG